MPNWKKVAVSGSNVNFNQITSSGDIITTGNVGIGTASPTEKLQVTGNI